MSAVRTEVAIARNDRYTNTRATSKMTRTTVRAGRGARIGLLLALTPTFGHAQAVQGRVVDASTQAPIEGATVALVKAEYPPLAHAISGLDGRFTLAAEATGRYQLSVDRIGYRHALSGEIELVRGDTLAVELRLSVEAIVLDPLVVTSRPAHIIDPRLENKGFYRRMDLYEGKMGFATFIHYEDIQRRNPARTTDIFQTVRRVRVVSQGGRRVQLQLLGRPTPMMFCVDGARFRPLEGESINDYVHPAEISGIEIYPTSVGPAELGGCQVVIWTGFHEAESRQRDNGS